MTDAEAAMQALTEQIQALQHEVSQQQAAMTQQQEEISQQLAVQRQTIAQQQAELAALQARTEEADRERQVAATAHRGKKTSRRRLLTTAGAAAAAATAAAVALGAGNASIAHAANGDPLLLGKDNTASSITSLATTGSPGTSPLLNLNNTGSPSGAVALLASVGSQGVAVQGTATGDFSRGVLGQSDTGTGASGMSTSGVGGVFKGGRAPLNLAPAGSPGAPASGAHVQGDIFVDSNATLWVCIKSGTPGTWVRLTSVLNGTTGGATTYLSKPIRLLDTRSGVTDAKNNGGGPYAAGSTHTLTIAGVTFNGVTVPSLIAGAMGKITATDTAGGGYIALLPHGVAFSGTANLPFGPGETVAIWFNSAVVSGELDIYIGSSATDVVLDLFGVVS